MTLLPDLPSPLARCDDCGRAVWSPRSLTPWRGRRLGSQCRRKHDTPAIPNSTPWNIPGQTTLETT